MMFWKKSEMDWFCLLFAAFCLWFVVFACLGVDTLQFVVCCLVFACLGVVKRK